MEQSRVRRSIQRQRRNERHNFSLAVLTLLGEVVRLAVADAFGPPCRLELLALVVRELHLLLGLDDLDPSLDDELARCLLKGGEAGCVVVLNGRGSEGEGVHRRRRG
jgi:hypothetical protein